jgi:hypothetical protein
VGEHVDATGGECREAVAKAKRGGFVLVCIAKHGRCDGAAEIDVETSHHALVVRRGEVTNVFEE